MPLVPLLRSTGYVPGPKSLGTVAVTVSLATGTPTLTSGVSRVSLGTVAATVSVATEYPGLSVKQRMRAAVTIAVCDSTPNLRARRVPPSMRANVTVRVATRYPQLRAAGSPLPEGDGTGWTIPDATPPDILAMRFTVGTQRLENARIRSCDIKLSDRGGYDSCTLTYALRRVGELNPKWHTRLLVTYKNTDVFRGRLEESTCEVADDLTRTLVFTGPICKLDDHQAFRRVYVDSDLDNWRTDQGPQTQANVWEVSAT